MSFLDTATRAKSYLREHGRRVSLGALLREFDLEENALEERIEELVEIQHVGARVAYLERGLQVTHDAIARGGDVRGLFHWTAIDSDEWLHGCDVAFGNSTRRP